MTAPTIGALFAGYGGLEMAVQEALGGIPAWVSEIEPGPSRILAQRYPGVPNIGDVTAVDWAAVEPVDIITGGSPCQDLSQAGKRAGMKAGTRSGLWASMCDAIDIIRPQLVVWENVRGALTAEGEPPTPEILDLEAERERTRRAITTVDRRLRRAQNNGEASHVRFHRRDAVRLSRRLERQVGAVRRARAGLVRAIGRVLGDLAELGYDAAWCGLRAADVGAPHGRFRVFVLAWPADATGEGLEAWGEGRPGGGLAGLGGRAADLTLLPSPRTSDTNGPGVHGDGGLDLRTAVTLLPTPLAEPGGVRGVNAQGSPALHEVVALDLLPTPTTEPTTGNGHARNLGAEARLLPTPRATDGTKGGPNQRGSSGDLMLPSAVLLPTPKATNNENQQTSRTKGLNLDEVRSSEFGQYAPAIARWETVLSRPAPTPTEPTGRGGAQRLAPKFVEFMMGLPDGWVTDVGLTRNEQLKALGNGVVPQQATAAIRHLLAVRAAALTGQEVAA